MRKQDKQNSIELKKRLSIGFGIVTMITILAILISFFTFYGLYLTNAISTKLFSSFTIILLILVFTAIIASSIICKIINKSIVKPLNILINIAKQMAVGDASANVRVLTNDEVGELMKAFKEMIENTRKQAHAAEVIAAGDLTIDVKINSEKDVLNAALCSILEKNNYILSQIDNASAQVVTGAGQISDASIRLSQGACEQASSIQELTATIEEIKSQIDLNAANANKAKAYANHVKDDAIGGNKHMEEMLKAMNEINVSSSNISKIIKVIEDIAFQTNILSLNAAVEASRAGQYGKGFAVVAEEVRSLATRSAEAAKETTDMIEASIKKAEHGTVIAKITATSFNEIVEGIEKVAEIVGEIANASTEQSSSIDQINNGISQVSGVVQENSAASEESAAAIEELYQQSEMLKEMVGKFKLKKIQTAEIV